MKTKPEDLWTAIQETAAHPELLGLRKGDFWVLVGKRLGLSMGAVQKQAWSLGWLSMARTRPRNQVPCRAPHCDRMVTERQGYDAPYAGWCTRCSVRARRADDVL